MPDRDRDHAPIDRGSAIVFAILVLALLAMLGVGLLTLSGDSAKLGRADARAKQAFYTAEAGLEHARLALFASNGAQPFDGPLVTAAGSDGTLDLDPDALAPTFASDGRLIGFSAGVGDDVPVVAPTAFGDGGTYTVYLTNDAIDGLDDTDDTNNRVVLTAIGTTHGGSLEAVEAIIEAAPIWTQPPSAGLTLAGPMPTFDPGDEESTLFTGTDCQGAGVPGYYVPAVGAIGAAATANVQGQMGDASYEAGSLDEDDTVADVTDTAEAAVSSVASVEWTECDLMEQMVDALRDVADVVCTSPSCSLPPSDPDRIVFVEGDWQITNGEGVIVVTGEATLGNDVSWTGPILVVGEGILRRTGSGSGTVSGAIVVADIAGPDNVYGTSDDCGGAGCSGGDEEEDEEAADEEDEEGGGSGECSFQPATFETSGSGTPTIAYCSTALDDSEPMQLYDITSFRQR